MNNQYDDIRHLMRLYATRQASPEQLDLIREYLLDEPARFDILLEMMRRQAMEELDIKLEDDFLPSHLQRCSPAEFAECMAFNDVYSADSGPKISANIIQTQQPDMFELLRSVFLEEK